ncbi:hypothetical protein [Bacillus sp. UNCCL13]|nr:hypothetical protein [Bacillus sp. UNCCL13]
MKLSSRILYGFGALFEKFLNQEFMKNRENPEVLKAKKAIQ